MTKAMIDAQLRSRVFDWMFDEEKEIEISNSIQKINDRQYGCILTDENGDERYCRVGVIVAEQREDMTARELMESEIAAYQTKQAEKAEKAKAKAEKIEHDKAKREAQKPQTEQVG